MTTDTILALRELGAATVYEAQGATGALDGGIKPIDAAMRVAGPACTVDIRPGDNLMLHYALLKARPGDVLVVDAKGFMEAGPWGDVLTEQALHMGLAGLVIDGAVRDADAITRMGFPVFCRGLSIKGTGKNQPGTLNQPVSLGGVRIAAGDIVIGDRDGVVVVPRDGAGETLRLATLREHKEAAFRERIRRGATTADLLELREILRKFSLV